MQRSRLTVACSAGYDAAAESDAFFVLVVSELGIVSPNVPIS
jgi:hypothetical protein